MRDVLLYIKEDQVDWVFENEGVGSGSPSFKGMAKEGRRIFVVSKIHGELSVVGEVPISRVYEQPDNPRGWTFRVSADKGTSIRYPDPVKMAPLKDRLYILKGTADVWRQVQYPRWLATEDAELLSRVGRKAD